MHYARAGYVPASEDTQPHRRKAENLGVAVTGEPVEVVLRFATTDADEVRCVAADDAKTTGRY